MINQPSGTGIAGAMDQTTHGAMACHVCGAPVDIPRALRGLPSVGAVVACSDACAADDRFRPAAEVEVERLRAEVARLNASLATADNALTAIRRITGDTHDDSESRRRPYTALSQIDVIARKAQ